MAKYSTGGVGGGDGGACELCGAEGVSLRTATVAGARLQVCDECARHSDDTKDAGGGPQRRDDDRNRRKKAAQNVARLSDAKRADHNWEEGTDYEDDPLPYLVRGYGARVENARQERGLQIPELADALGVPVEELEAVEQGRAARAGIGGSLIEALESHLDIELAER